VERIEAQYPTPNSPEFRERKFDQMKWSKPEHRNFFTLIKPLTEEELESLAKKMKKL